MESLLFSEFLLGMLFVNSIPLHKEGQVSFYLDKIVLELGSDGTVTFLLAL
jgi:hypothetical protein